jgi:hypothetical protein
MRAFLPLLVLLGACTVDTGTIPSNRFAERDAEAVRRADTVDFLDRRALQPGLAPASRGAAAFAPF